MIFGKRLPESLARDLRKVPCQDMIRASFDGEIDGGAGSCMRVPVDSAGNHDRGDAGRREGDAKAGRHQANQGRP